MPGDDEANGFPKLGDQCHPVPRRVEESKGPGVEGLFLWVGGGSKPN